jgi:acyl carrier protein
MNGKEELLIRLQQIISEQLGVEEERVTETSTWTQLGADSLDRMGISMAIEDVFKVDIPHLVGEHLNTVGETVDHLSTLITAQREIPKIRIDAPTTESAMG